MQERPGQTSRRARPDTRARQTVRDLVGLLTGADGRARLLSLAAVAALPRAPRRWVIDRLAAALRGKGADRRRRAADALTALGRSAGPAVLLGLQRPGDPAWQVRHACVLARLAPALGPGYRAEVARQVGLARDLTGEEAVRRACEAARAALLGEDSVSSDVSSARAAGHG